MNIKKEEGRHMTYLPGFDNIWSTYFRERWTQAELVAYLSLAYLDIGVYSFSILLSLRNIWVILVKQKQYKNTSLLAFYVFSFVALILRLGNLIFMWT